MSKVKIMQTEQEVNRLVNEKVVHVSLVAFHFTETCDGGFMTNYSIDLLMSNL
jgi:hypothetical protein